MTARFKGKAVSKGISLPEDMWALLDERRQRDGIPVSRFVQDAVAQKLMDDVAKRHSELREPQTAGG